MKLLGLNKSLWIPKWLLSGFAPVGKVMQRYKFQTHAECPRCSEYKDTNHVLKCKAPRAVYQMGSVDIEAGTMDAASENDARLANSHHYPTTRMAKRYCGNEYILSLAWSQCTGAQSRYHWMALLSRRLRLKKLGSQTTGILHLAATKKHWTPMDNHLDQKNVGNIMDNVGTQKW